MFKNLKKKRSERSKTYRNTKFIKMNAETLFTCHRLPREVNKAYWSEKTKVDDR